jgi:hypothetical protein
MGEAIRAQRPPAVRGRRTARCCDASDDVGVEFEAAVVEEPGEPIPMAQAWRQRAPPAN